MACSEKQRSVISGRYRPYIYEAIQNNNAISVSFGWLGTLGNYINVLHECSNISDGEYYLAWKAVTDNTSPMIRSVKIVDTAI